MFEIGEILKNKAISAIAVPLLIASSIAGGMFYFKSKVLESENKTLTKQLATCEAHNEECKRLHEASGISMRMLEEQCQELKKGEQNKPVPKIDDSVTDEYLNKIFQKVK